MRTRTALPVVGSALGAVALAVGVALVVPRGSGEPEHLRLAGDAGTTRDVAAATPGSAGASGSGYVLTGELPSGRPDDAPAYTLPRGPADGDRVARLARALGEGPPTRDGSGWRAGGLSVSGDSGQSWWWSQCSPDTPVSSDSGRVACAEAVPGTVDPGTSGGGSSGSPGSGATTVSPPPPSPLPEPDPMPAAEVRRAVAPVFEALGLDLDRARVEGHPYGGYATLTPLVDGLEAWGMQTSVQVDREGTVQGANGWLAAPDRGDSYPLVTAKEAFDDLPPVMRTLACPIGPDGKGCAEPEPIEVTGARLGLALRPLAEGGQALVPAWLFEIKGWTEPQPVVAVQPQYLDDPSDQPTDTPATGKPEPTAVPPVDPGTAREPLSFDRAARGDTPEVVVVTYGESGSCPRTDVTVAAKETDEAVYVVLEAAPLATDRACTDDYRPVERAVRLTAPLGDRKVVDASTNREVPLS